MLWAQRLANVGWYTFLAHAYRRGNRYEEALYASGERLFEPELCRSEGLLCVQLGDSEEAERHLREGIRVACAINSRSMELRISTDLARLLESQAKKEEAVQLLAPAYNWFTEGF